ncbi:MAG: SGNH/GDSL hydrolase family protein [Candidatus Latescibacterota bacterium]
MGAFQVQDGQTFLAIGDSITDAGRRGDLAPFGNGYVSLFIEMVTAQFPDRCIRFINKGNGGNRITDLKERWEDDVIPNDPDWLSLMIGINDVHSYLQDPTNGVSVALFSETYDWILNETVQHTRARIVLMEPFYISTDRSGQTFRSQVLETTLPEYIAVVHDMSRKYQTRLVRLHELFQHHLKFRPTETFCPEPVHPNRSGHVVIATELLRAVMA